MWKQKRTTCDAISCGRRGRGNIFSNTGTRRAVCAFSYAAQEPAALTFATYCALAFLSCRRCASSTARRTSSSRSRGAPWRPLGLEKVRRDRRKECSSKALDVVGKVMLEQKGASSHENEGRTYILLGLCPPCARLPRLWHCKWWSGGVRAGAAAAVAAAEEEAPAETAARPQLIINNKFYC